MATCIAQQSLSQISTTKCPQKLLRAVTYDSMASRKRLLSEQHERHNFMTQYSSDDICTNKRTKKESLVNDSKDNNQHHVLSFSSPTFEKATHCRSLSDHQRRKSLIHINNISSSQSTIFPQPLTTNDMLVCQKKSVIINNNENEHEMKPDHSILLTSTELSAYITSMINTQNERLLIIDCGSPLRYNERRINESFLLNISDKLSRKRLLNRGLKKFLDQNHLTRLNESETIILYDDSIHSSSSCSNSIIQLPISSSIKCIFDEITRYDTNKKIFILQSSFEEFYQNYPLFCYLSTYTPTNDISSPSPTRDLESYEMSEVIPGLYLGNAHDAENMNVLNENQIKSIINISKTIPCYYENEILFEYLRLTCNDSCQENILQYFETTFEYIHKKLLLNQNILVHCQGGISRSPSFVIGYLMKYHSKTFDQAYALVKGKRKIINPNLNFLAQLTRYEQMIMSSTK